MWSTCARVADLARGGAEDATATAAVGGGALATRGGDDATPPRGYKVEVDSTSALFLSLYACKGRDSPRQRRFSGGLRCTSAPYPRQTPDAAQPDSTLSGSASGTAGHPGLRARPRKVPGGYEPTPSMIPRRYCPCYPHTNAGEFVLCYERGFEPLNHIRRDEDGRRGLAVLPATGSEPAGPGAADGPRVAPRESRPLLAHASGIHDRLARALAPRSPRRQNQTRLNRSATWAAWLEPTAHATSHAARYPILLVDSAGPGMAHVPCRIMTLGELLREHGV